MVKLGVRVIHKITSEARCTELPSHINQPNCIMPKTLRLRLSPKALKLANKFSHTPPAPPSSSAHQDEQQQKQLEKHKHVDPVINEENKGAMSRIDVEKGSFYQHLHQNKTLDEGKVST